MARAVMLFVLKLAVVSVVFFLLWKGSLPGGTEFWPGGVEELWFAWQMAVLRWLYGIFHLNAEIFNQAWQLARGYSLSIIPYLGLMVVGGPLKLRGRLLRGLYGLLIIAAWQICTPLILYFLQSTLGEGKSFFVGIFPVFMFSYALPFVLWVVFSRDRIEKWFTKRDSTPRTK